MKIFLAHSAADESWTRQFTQSLRKEGINIWLSEEQVSPGKPFEETVFRGIANCDLVVMVIDPKSINRPNVLLEAGMALGLGKEVTYIAPKPVSRSARKPAGSSTGSFLMGLSKKKLLYRQTPAATARALLRAKRLKP
jgi:TIR domain